MCSLSLFEYFIEVSRAREELLQGVYGHSPANRRDRFGQRDLLGTHFDAVLCVSAIAHAARADECIETRCFLGPPGLMFVEQSGLTDRVSPDKGFVPVRGCGLKTKLRTGLQTASATHAFTELVSSLLILRSCPWSGPEIVHAVDRNPCLDALQRMKYARSIHEQVADRGKLAHRLKRDYLTIVRRKIIDQGAACLPDMPIDEHGAGAADFFQATGVICDRCR